MKAIHDKLSPKIGFIENNVKQWYGPSSIVARRIQRAVSRINSGDGLVNRRRRRTFNRYIRSKIRR